MVVSVRFDSGAPPTSYTTTDNNTFHLIIRAECQTSINRHRAECEASRQMSMELEKEKGRLAGKTLAFIVLYISCLY